MINGMRTHKGLDRLISAAEAAWRCFWPKTNAEKKAVSRRLHDGELVRPHRNMYARVVYWDSLNPAERSRHVIRSLHEQYPHRVFAGLSAAAIMQLEYPWSLHDGGMVFIATRQSSNAGRAYGKLRRISMTDVPVCEVGCLLLDGEYGRAGMDVVVSDDVGAMVPANRIICIIPVTSPARTLVDCGLRYEFAQALPMVDSALRRQLVTKREIAAACDGVRADCVRVRRLLHYADPLSENGGESWCRAVIIELGFVAPRLQHEFVDPETGFRCRVDFVWFLPDGRIVVLEYDGMRKYVDPTMTGGRDVRAVVQKERLRQDTLVHNHVTMVIRTDYVEVMRRTPLRVKLTDAGIPQLSG
ncbi:CTP synthase [Bifidobacterium amazonense]|uniref:CTP synthase n=1 Tax=Bifidobacterium amazonense TaxID=2809027 RepID=A0ABS9VV60_9BIFI|nr:CTP synthase [Bifidobacterium amazonense]MCH9275982.1 CTP synthase [Bifidobacterium amazonense]